MTKQVWLPVDGELLKKLREQAGVELTTLARFHSLSPGQVKQLEDGGDSGFYTPAIKLATGRKLLTHFGADVAPLDTDAQQDQNLGPEIAKDLALQESDAAIEKVSIDAEKNKRFLYWLFPSIAILIVGYAFFNVYEARSKNGTKPAQTNSQMPLAQPIAIVSEEVLAQTPVKTASQTPEECRWPGAPLPVMGHQPAKSGDYVHLVANADGEICIKDGTGKLQILHLKVAQSQTVRGRPPFEIFSSNLNDIKIFYQGNVLRLPSSDIQYITLKEQKYE